MGESSSSRATSAHSTKVSTTSFVARPSSRDSHNTLRCARNRPRRARPHRHHGVEVARTRAPPRRPGRAAAAEDAERARFGADSTLLGGRDSSATASEVSSRTPPSLLGLRPPRNAARFTMELAGVARPVSSAASRASARRPERPPQSPPRTTRPRRGVVARITRSGRRGLERAQTSPSRVGPRSALPSSRAGAALARSVVLSVPPRRGLVLVLQKRDEFRDDIIRRAMTSSLVVRCSW